MIRSCNDARNSARILNRYKCTIDPVVGVLTKGSQATLRLINGQTNGMAGTCETPSCDVSHEELSHLWSLNEEARNPARELDCKVMEALLDIYRQQREYEKAAGTSGATGFEGSLKDSSSKV
jgi:hypothetical protein